MRMWMLPPVFLCRKHLLGEHVELHMIAGSLIRHKTLDGFARDGLIEPSALPARHAALATEMLARGYKHQSPLPAEAAMAAMADYPPHIRESLVDTAQSRKDLIARCPDCAARIKNFELA